MVNKEGDDFDFVSKSLVAAVIAQIFSYMIQNDIQCGYVFVREFVDARPFVPYVAKYLYCHP
jgi:hypothetical protein